MSIGYKKFQSLPEKNEISEMILKVARETQAEGWAISMVIARTSKRVGYGVRIVESVIRSDESLMNEFRKAVKKRYEDRQSFLKGVDRGYN